MTIINIHDIYLEIDDEIYKEITNCDNINDKTKFYENSNANLYIGFLKSKNNISKNNMLSSEQYYNKALEQNNKISYYFLGLLYYSYDEYNNAIKYFTLAIEHDKYNTKTIYYLARSYHLKSNIQDFEKAKYYYLMGIECGDKNALRMLRRITDNDIEFYNLLINNKKNNNLINEWIKMLENTYEIKLYKIKNNLIKTGYKQCNGCLEDNIYVTHNYCTQCFFTEQNIY